MSSLSFIGVLIFYSFYFLVSRNQMGDCCVLIAPHGCIAVSFENGSYFSLLSLKLVIWSFSLWTLWNLELYELVVLDACISSAEGV